jgi:hypothetical protein
MGDISDFQTLERFMRCSEGLYELERIRAELRGKRIVDVRFENAVHHIAIDLYLEDGEVVSLTKPDLALGTIEAIYEDAIKSEYFVDFPERRPTDS